jgi:phage minor structural protein
VIFAITNFNTLATTTQLGVPLPDALTCQVHEVRNGLFDLTLTYPVTGAQSDRLAPNVIIMAEPRPDAAREPFRVYECERNLQGIITCRAHHIAYDLDGKVALGMSETGITAAVNAMNAWCGNYFEIVNDGITDETRQFGIVTPISVWNAIGGQNSLVSHFGGELSYHWDESRKKCVITLHDARGEQKNTIIRYGVNIVSMNRKQTVGNMYSYVMAFWSDGKQTQNTVWSNSVATGVTTLDRWLLLDYSKEFETAPTSYTLTALATDYVSKHDFSTISDLSVEYIPLENTTDYAPLNVAIVDETDVDYSYIGGVENFSVSAPLDLCDTAFVSAALVGVTATAKCVETVYDVLLMKYAKVTIGTLTDTIVDTISNLTKE